MSSGTWNLDRGIMARWTEKNLDAQFRQDWPGGAGVQDFVTLNDTEARPTRGNQTHPVPYCVFEKGEPIQQGGASGGDSATIVIYEDIPVQFTIFAHSKSKAIEYADKVKNAYDRGALNVSPDVLIEVFNDGDVCRRIDDELWSWVIMYRYRIERSYQGALS